MYTAAVVQVSLHKHNDNHILPGIYLSTVPSISVQDLFKKAVNNDTFLGNALKRFYKLCTSVTAFKFTQFLCIVFSV